MKKVVKDNYRVVVYPDQPEWREPDYILSDCENIIAQIKRHVDDVEEINIEHDTKEICSFCNSIWEIWEANDEMEPHGCKKGQPMCCDEAIKEWEKNRKTTQKAEMAAFENMSNNLLGIH